MMHMTFYWGRSVTILFDSWQTNSWPGYFLSLFALFLFGAFYQYMEERCLRLKLLSVAKPPPSSAAEAPLLNKLGGRRWGPYQIAGAVLFGVNSANGYCLMLAVMSFNALMRRSPESASMRNAVVDWAAEVRYSSLEF
ncbi:copper transporter 5.1-like [Salvia hispanica]|uniref:copper transporter 5.1-like n=1 Tax=Salvia hispanica TaxID=49212 RepID=UPI002009D1B4|nr:copper transporter 5.1-like [Salvia hispanica]